MKGMTKQFTLLLLFLVGGMVSFAQSTSFVFLNAGVPIADNSRVYCGNLPDGLATAPITIQKQSDETITAKLTISVSENSSGTGFVGYCGWGFTNCVPVTAGSSVSSDKTVTNKNAIDPEVETLGTEAPFSFEVEYKLTYNGQEQKINVVLSSESGSAIHTPDASDAVFVSYQGNKAALKYNFSSTTGRQVQIYNLTGRKIAEISLTRNSGTVILPDLPKGIYLYSIMENGKIITSDKYITN